MLDAYRDVVRSRLARRLLVLAAVSAPPRETYPIALVLVAACPAIGWALAFGQRAQLQAEPPPGA